jgi:hypothetical protein
MTGTDRDIIARLHALIVASAHDGTAECAIREHGLSIRFRRQVPVAAGISVHAPLKLGAGVLRLSAPDADFELPVPGDPVRAGQILGFLQHGPVFAAIRSTADGRLAGREVKDRTPVLPGQAIFRIRPKTHPQDTSHSERSSS